jgi:phage N-6-adenine-methyltransferase
VNTSGISRSRCQQCRKVLITSRTKPWRWCSDACRKKAWRKRQAKAGHAFFSSASVEWSTPWTLFNELDAEFNFNLDVCATEDNAKCQWFYSPEDDGLRQEWHGTCWMNPPYGRTIGEWVAKAHESAKSDDTLVVCLLPVRTDTRWWHDHVTDAEIRFLKGRVRFNDAGPAPFPSCVVIFR